MPETKLRRSSLVLYKNRLGRVRQIDSKLEIEVEDGSTIKVRPKDVTLLHPGPVENLSGLQIHEGEIETAWELLVGETTNLAELAELIYGEYTPAAAWAVWQLVVDGLYFGGSTREIVVRTPEFVARARAKREAKAAEKKAWAAFAGRAQAGRHLPEDEHYLRNVESLALEKHDQSPVLRSLGHAENPQNAHALLLALGFWDHTINPYPEREGISTSTPEIQLPGLTNESRHDLTHLNAWAIDDEGNRDPDDALSLEAGRLWVHIADAAALVPPDSPADMEARGRGANLYLPEGTVPMLPPEATQVLGLGLSEISPALSFGMEVTDEGEVGGLEIVASWVRVTRLTYEQIDARLDEREFQRLYALAQKYEERRHQNGAIRIELPEVKVEVRPDGEVVIRPLPPLRSRDMVREAMLMTGEAVARYALEHDIPVPFTVQDPPEESVQNGDEPTLANGLAGMFALRRMMRRGQQQNTPAPHAGLGMDLYIQCTSPLRRYLDLLAHQQLRAHVRGEKLLDVQEVMERVGAADAVTGSVRRTERLSNTHWGHVYLLQNPEWSGEGIVVDRRGARVQVLIPELGLETQVYPRRDLPLNSRVNLTLTDVNLADQEAHFQVSTG
jgi:exoribonuclease-2